MSLLAPVRAGGMCRRIVFLLLLSLGVAPGQIFTTEPFNANLNGWSNNAPGATANWAWNAGSARGVFNTDPVPNSILILRATSNASGGAFVGNYRAAGVTLMGFDYLAEQLNPSSVRVELYRGPDWIEAFFSDFGPTGVWNRFAISLADRGVAGWLTPTDSDEEFEYILDAVSEVRIHVQRGGAPPVNAVNRLDNIFIDRLHLGGGIDAAADNAALTWGDLRTGRTYRVEATTNLSAGGWNTLTNFIATNTVAGIMLNDLTNHPIRLYRLILE